MSASTIPDLRPFRLLLLALLLAVLSGLSVGTARAAEVTRLSLIKDAEFAGELRVNLLEKVVVMQRPPVDLLISTTPFD